jgi:hypothetical protein
MMEILSVELIRARIEGMLGWKRGDSDRFSLPTLLAFIRGKNSAVEDQLSAFIQGGGHIYRNRVGIGQ